MRYPEEADADDVAVDETSGIACCGFELAKGFGRSCGSPRSVSWQENEGEKTANQTRAHENAP